MITGALVAMVIDFLLKEGQGLGASGYKDHIVVCGWNTTARDLIEELRGDDYKQKVVVIADVPKNPAGSGVYFVRGDATNAADLARAGIEEAASALDLPDRFLGRRRHALDPDHHGHRVGRAGRPDRGRGQQPAPRTAFPAGGRRRAAGDLEDRVAPAGSLGAVPGPVAPRDRHRVRRRGLRAVPDHAARGVPRALDRRGRRPSSASSIERRCSRSIAAATRSSIRGPTSAWSRTTTPWSWPSRSGRWRRSQMHDTTDAARRPPRWCRAPDAA